MPLPLPNLDDRKWADLVEEGRSLIPFYAPGWTDHNVHDPGIMLIELFAWLAEMDIYQLNRIPDRHFRKFLMLSGIYPQPPQPAHTVLSFSLVPKSDNVELPAFVAFEGKDPYGETVHFLTQYPINVVPAKLEAIQLFDGSGFREIKRENGLMPQFSIFGSIPKPGACIYFGFSEDISQHGSTHLFFQFAGARKDEAERWRFLAEIMPGKSEPGDQPQLNCVRSKHETNIRQACKIIQAYNSGDLQVIENRYESLLQIKLRMPFEFDNRKNYPVYIDKISIRYTDIKGEEKLYYKNYQTWLRIKDILQINLPTQANH